MKMEKTILLALVVTTLNFSQADSLSCSARRKWVADQMILPINFWASSAMAASAANMPDKTGAIMSQIGSIDKLLPIVCAQRAFIEIQAYLHLAIEKTITDREAATVVHRISERISAMGLPTDEKKFKRMFDEYSQPPTYKQKFQNQNAFLVYYTNGFDGSGRPAFGTAEAENAAAQKQMVQYGARNDAWVAFDEFLTEVKYFEIGSSKLDDVGQPLARVVKFFAEYLQSAPSQQLQEADKRACPSNW